MNGFSVTTRDWVASDVCRGRVLNPGQSCTITVFWQPTAGGNTSFFFSSSAFPGGTVSAQLKGDGLNPASLSVTPATFDFGNVAVAAAIKPTQTFTITNTGDVPSGTVAIALASGAPDFALQNSTCPATLASGASCSVDVLFAPGTPGSKSGSFTVAASPGGSKTVTLAGFGTAPANLQISATTIDFGHIVLGDHVDGSVVISNVGSDPSGPLSIALTGSQHFTVIGNSCGATLAGLQTCTVSLRYMPDVAGSHSATLSTAASPGGSLTTSLTGSAEAPVAATLLAPVSVDFGGVAFGSTTTQTITFKNVGQTTVGPLATGGSTVESPFPELAPAFSVVGNGCLGVTLAQGQSCQMVVQFHAVSLPGGQTTYSGLVDVQGVPTPFKSVPLAGHVVF
jgi:hypothetical protein